MGQAGSVRKNTREKWLYTPRDSHSSSTAAPIHWLPMILR